MPWRAPASDRILCQLHLPFRSGQLCAEGIGLLREKRWAEYLTVIATVSLIPFELYELIARVTAPRIILLIVNVAVVAYLVREVRRGRHRAT